MQPRDNNVLPFKAELKGTTIGSLPHLDAGEAIELVFQYLTLLPSWVQLPKYPAEGMLQQYNQGLPGLKQQEERTYFDTADAHFEQTLLQFYEDYLGVTDGGSLECLQRFALAPDHARGFFAFMDMLSEKKIPGLQTVKGQITGPFTLGTGLKDQHGKYAFYDDRLRDVIVKQVCLQAKWQIHTLGTKNVSVLMFLDEPSLAGFGSSAYLGVQSEDIQTVLHEAVDFIHNEHGWVGIHCCENTDWSLLLTIDIDVLSFDAYGFFDKVLLYKEALLEFISRGATLAWGIVPTHSEELLQKESAASLIRLWREKAQSLAKEGVPIEKIAAQSLITPSCGAGSLSVDSSVVVLQLVAEISRTLRAEFGLS